MFGTLISKLFTATATAGVVAAVVAGAAGVWFHGAGGVRAPEPARLISGLSGSYSATAAAVYVDSRTNTTVIKWSSTYVSTPNPPAAGQPCGTADMGTGSTTWKTIQAYGSYRRCV